jgi:hypothetical protein
MRGRQGAAFLKRVVVVAERIPPAPGFPFSLPFVPSLDLLFERAVTYFVGENGSGKSTLVEAIAEACGLPIWGGGRNEAATRQGPEERSALGGSLRCSFARRPGTTTSFGPSCRPPSPPCSTSVARIPRSSTTRSAPMVVARSTGSRTVRRSWRSF